MKKPFPDASTYLLILGIVTLPGLSTAFPPDSKVDPEQQRVLPQATEQISLDCFRSTDPDIRSVDLLYNMKSDEGSLWSGKDGAPQCSSTSEPPLSSCKVCHQHFIYVVCGNLSQNVALVLEGGGQQIRIKRSECPQLLGKVEHHAAAGNHAGGPDRRVPVLLSLLLVILIAR